MCLLPAASEALAAIPDAKIYPNALLAGYTRFAIGGPAAILFDTGNEAAFLGALQIVRNTRVPHIIIGGGTNLIVSDFGYGGVALRYTGSTIDRHASLLHVCAGAVLQDVVDTSIDLGLKGLETMTGIPGYLGGAVYGNAGAYGHSIQELVQQIRVFDGSRVATMQNEDCRFSYRESIFKNRKEWIILSADLRFSEGDSGELSKIASEIRSVRDAKYPPGMKCAGSIFKNMLLRNLPAAVAAEIPGKIIREGKIPSAWFLEQVGAKGLRLGNIQVADYHANLIYNGGAGTAADLVAVINELKSRVWNRFGFELEEEVQFVGFDRIRPIKTV